MVAANDVTTSQVRGSLLEPVSVNQLSKVLESSCSDDSKRSSETRVVRLAPQLLHVLRQRLGSSSLAAGRRRRNNAGAALVARGLPTTLFGLVGCGPHKSRTFDPNVESVPEI